MQLFADVKEIHGETPMSESLYNKVVGWRQLCYKVDYNTSIFL